MTSDQVPGEILTFYSYKGGTGRSMALANIACLLAQQQESDKPVLVIDWDLEAPGLHLFFRDLLTKGTRDPEKMKAILNDGAGLIDLLTEVRKRIEGTSGDSGTQQTEEEACELLQRIEFDRFVLATDNPRLYLLKAGRFDGDYPRRVNTFNWEDLYNRSPWLFQSFAGFLTDKYKYVLIDSRTGRTDTSNICTMLMPQKLVVVFTPNRQSLTGVEDLVTQATAYRRKSDDIRPLLVYPLPSRIENSEPRRREEWRFGNERHNIVGYQFIFQEVFKEAYALSECDLAPYFDAVQVQHVPSYAYGEELAVLTERGTDISSLHFRFKTFCDWLVSGAPPWEAAQILSKKEEELAHQLEEEKKKSAALRRQLRVIGAIVLGLALTLTGTAVGVKYYRYLAPRWQLQKLGLSVENQQYPTALIITGVSNATLAKAIPILSSFTDLVDLRLIGAALTDVSPLNGLQNLTTLNLSKTAVTDVSSLKNNPNLTTLDLSGAKITDLSSLSGLTSLHTLNLSQTSVSDLSPLKNLTALRNLDLPGTSVSDLSPLQNLTGLGSLDLSQTRVSDLSPLKNLTALDYLDLSQTSVSDLSPLENLTALQYLYLSQTSVSDLSPLKNDSNLGFLDLDGTKVIDVSPLKGLTNLKYLWIEHTGVTDVSPLKDLKIEIHR